MCGVAGLSGKYGDLLKAGKAVESDLAKKIEAHQRKHRQLQGKRGLRRIMRMGETRMRMNKQQDNHQTGSEEHGNGSNMGQPPSNAQACDVRQEYQQEQAHVEPGYYRGAFHQPPAARSE